MKVEKGQRYYFKDPVYNFDSLPENTEEERAAKAAAILTGFTLEGPYTVRNIYEDRALLIHDHQKNALVCSINSNNEMVISPDSWILIK